MSSENQWKEGGNNTECSDSNTYSSSNNSNSDDNGSSKTDQKLPVTMKSSNNKQENIKQAVATHKELPATIPLPSAGPAPQNQQLYVQHRYNDYGNKAS
eukprot:15359877-Ditylum_brightwellii.AAC.1